MSNFYQHAGNQSPKKIFLDRQTPLKYGELHCLIGQMTAYLNTTNLSAGDKVVIGTENDAWLVVIFFALIDNGITVIITDSNAKPSEFATLCAVTKPMGYILDTDIIERCKPTLSATNLILQISKITLKKPNLLTKLIKNNPQESEQSFPGILNQFSPEEPKLNFPSDRIAYIILTSGSTSQPKAIPITWTSLNTHLETLKRQFSYNEQSRILNLLPLFHADGMIQGPTIACFSGCTWVRPFHFSIQNIEPLLHTFYKREITHFICVPTILALMLRLGAHLQDSFETDDFKFIISAAGKLDKSLWHDFQHHFKVKIANLYGLTETVTGAIFCGPSDHNFKIGSIGKPVDCEAMLIDEHDNEILDVGKDGELLLKGDNVFSGYLNADQVNQALFFNGWMRTGDLARKDSQGFFYITGRLKNVVISGGENIYPEEVTEIITNHPSITAAVTFGIANAEWGESLVALIVPLSTKVYNENDLITWCRERLSSYKIPRVWTVVNKLPYGPSGKILLAEAKKLYQTKSGVDSFTKDADINTKILSIAAEIFHISIASLNRYSAIDNTSGWDSLAHINLIIEIELRFNIKISTSEIMQIFDLNTAIEIVKSKL